MRFPSGKKPIVIGNYSKSTTLNSKFKITQCLGTMEVLSQYLLLLKIAVILRAYYVLNTVSYMCYLT